MKTAKQCVKNQMTNILAHKIDGSEADDINPTIGAMRLLQ
jgi:hypothetical protein